MKNKKMERQVIQIDDGEIWWVYAKDFKDAVKTLRKIGDFEYEDEPSHKIIPKKDWKKLKCHDEARKRSITFDKLILANELLNGEKSFLLAATLF